MRLVIIDPETSGHHGVYMAWIAEGLAKRGNSVSVIVGRGGSEHPMLRKMSSQGGEVVRLLECNSSFSWSRARAGGAAVGLARREFAYWRYLRACGRDVVSKINPDLVFVPYVDFGIHALAALGWPLQRFPWAGITMRPRFHHAQFGIDGPTPSFAGTRRRLFSRLLAQRSMRTLFALDDTLVQYYSDSEMAGKLRHLPDPVAMAEVPPRSQAIEQLLLPANTQWLVLFGSVSSRKGVRELLDALSDRHFPRNVAVLIAGRVQEDARGVMSSARVNALIREGRLRVLDHFLSPSDEAAVFGVADAIWAGYVGHYGPSGVVAQAGASGTPVVASESGLIGFQVSRFRMGRTVNPRDPSEVARVVRGMLSDPRGMAQMGANGRRAFGDNTTDRAVNLIDDALRQSFTKP